MIEFANNFFVMRSVLMRFIPGGNTSRVVCWQRSFTSLSNKVDSPDVKSDSGFKSESKKDDPQHLTQEAQNTYENDVKIKILEASLPFVPEHGWSKNAISAGAETLGYPGVIHGMFPRGGFDLIQHFYISSNKKTVEFLMKNYPVTECNKQESDDKNEGVRRQKIEKAVKVRLECILPYVKQWPQALAIMSLPPNVPTSLANLLCLVDDIFYYTGDTSVDLSWYGRRIALASIYKATELYMLQDSSVDYTNTWDFLHRRMDDADQLRTYLQASEQVSHVAKDFTTSAFITARSILGLRWDR